MSPEKVDSLADDVKPLVLELLRQISGLTAHVNELVAQNKALLVRIAELEAEHGKRRRTTLRCRVARSDGGADEGEESPLKAVRARRERSQRTRTMSICRQSSRLQHGCAGRYESSPGARATSRG